MSRPYQGRSPCGERGLKSSPRRLTPLTSASLPVRGAWIEIQVIVTPNAFCTSLPVRGAWIEINGACPKVGAIRSRSPCGERGLKYNIQSPMIIALCRSPCGERGLKWLILWITRLILRRSPCGERGLKSAGRRALKCFPRRSPCGERGLKLLCELVVRRRFRRSPCGERGLKSLRRLVMRLVSRRSPCGERGLKYPRSGPCPTLPWSLPARGAWIEMGRVSTTAFCAWVAPRAGSVD